MEDNIYAKRSEAWIFLEHLDIRALKFIVELVNFILWTSNLGVRVTEPRAPGSASDTWCTALLASIVVTHRWIPPMSRMNIMHLSIMRHLKSLWLGKPLLLKRKKSYVNTFTLFLIFYYSFWTCSGLDEPGEFSRNNLLVLRILVI